jgi:transcriptional regulator with GAF, ATPase, and Fis domain
MVKPFREKDLLVMLDIAKYKFALQQNNTPQTGIASQNTAFNGIVGKSKALTDVLQKIGLVAPTDTSVLV